MREENIESVIDQINSGSGENHIFIRPLIDSTKFGKVWISPMSGNFNQRAGETFYFIYDNNETCIAAVLDMGADDLHCFVKPEYRRRGVMSETLMNIILPHLFSQGRSEQRVTFQSLDARHLLEKVGFTILDSCNAIINTDTCAQISFPLPQNLPFTKGEMKASQQRARIAANFLRMICANLELVGETVLHEEVEALVDDLVFLEGKIEDTWWKEAASNA